MRVSLVDPSAFTPPYDRSLAAALARAGADVELLTSHFLYGPVPEPEGYAVREDFYGLTAGMDPGSRLRLPAKALGHFPGMLHTRRHVRGTAADVVHWQWVTWPSLDRFLLSPPDRPRVFTLHYPLPAADDERALARQHSFLSRFDAVISHTTHGAERLVADAGLEPDRVHVIPHGPLDYLTGQASESPLPAELAGEGGDGPQGPVILFFGLLRPYKGIDTLLEAFAALDPGLGAELWIAGMPRMPVEPLHELAERAEGRVRFLPRFVSDPEIPALMRRADVLALPYREIEQSGVLYAGLAFGKAMVLGDVGGFSEVGREHRAASLVPPGDAGALAAELERLLGDPGARASLEDAARAAVAGSAGWDAIAARTLELYESLVARR